MTTAHWPRVKLAQVLSTAALGLFLARLLYELAPVQLGLLGDWPGTLVLTLTCVTIVCLFVRIDLTPLSLLSVYVLWPEVDLHWALVLLIGSIALTVLNVIGTSRTRWVDLSLIVVTLGLYLLTLGDHVGRADTFEFQVVMPQLGIAHPTGYPLFILIGKVFSLLPLGSMAFRTNLASALFATGAVWLTYRVIVVLVSDRLTALIAALALAASRVFWSQAVVVEVYALNALFVTAILGLLVQSVTNGSAFRMSRSVLYSLFLLFGLAFSHHLTSVILLPPIALTLILTSPRLSLKAGLVAVGCLLIGLSPWLYIPLRWPALHNGTPMTIAEWLGWIFGQRFGGALNLSLWNDPTRWGIISRIALEQFGPIGACLALIGLLVLLKRSWRAALITFAAFAGYWFYGLVYNVPDVDVFVIPVFIVMAIWSGIGVHAVANWIESAIKRLNQSANQAVLATRYSLLALLPLSLIAGNFSSTSEHGRAADLEAWGRYVLSLPIPDHAAILADSEKIAPLYYLQVTEHLRPDLDILVLGDEAEYRQQLDQRLNAGQPVYLARFLPNLPYRMRSLGPLVEVSAQPLMSAPTFQRSIGATFGSDIELWGADETFTDPYRITLYWQALSEQRHNYHIRLRLIDSTGQVWWEDRGAHPVSGYYPTGAWIPNEMVPDFHEIAVEPFVPAGVYDLEVGLFVPFRDEALKVNGADWLKVSQVQVTPQDAAPLTHEVRIVSGARVITSVDVPAEVAPAGQVAVRFNTLGAGGSNIHLTLIADNDAPSINQDYVMQATQTRATLIAPKILSEYAVQVAFDEPTRCRWLAPLTDACSIGTMNVAGEAIGNAINFDNQVLLTGSQFDRPSLQPGETLKVDLTWRGLKTWSADYTAFVHLVGPDGKVHGQVDQWPLQGTLPTSSWNAGQVVNDPYLITLPADAPSGKYQIEVGWYLLATLRRLSVLDAAGRPSDDKVIIGEFDVP